MLRTEIQNHSAVTSRKLNDIDSQLILTLDGLLAQSSGARIECVTKQHRQHLNRLVSLERGGVFYRPGK
jgi:hypothetical protein